MKIMKISKYCGSLGDCGGFTGPKQHKHLDTQMFPECPSRSLTEQKKRRHRKHKKSSLDFDITVTS